MRAVPQEKQHWRYYCHHHNGLRGKYVGIHYYVFVIIVFPFGKGQPSNKRKNRNTEQHNERVVSRHHNHVIVHKRRIHVLRREIIVHYFAHAYHFKRDKSRYTTDYEGKQ